MSAALKPPLTGVAHGLSNNKVFIPQIWSNEVRMNRDSKLFMRTLCEVETFEGKKGDVLHIPIVDDVEIHDKQPSTPVTFQAQESTEFTMTIGKHKEVSFLFEDVLSTQANYNTRRIWTNRAGYAMRRDMDNYVLGLRAAIPLVQWIFCTSDGTAAGDPLPLNDASIMMAREMLDSADVPDEQGDRALVTSPSGYTDLLSIQKFIDRDYIDGRPVATGEIGSIYGMRVQRTSNIKTNSLTGYKNGKNGVPQPTPGVNGSPYMPWQESATVWNNGSANVTGLPRGKTGFETTAPFATSMIAHRSWCKLAVTQEIRSESGRMIEYLADALVFSSLYDAKTYRQDSIILIHHKA